MLNKIEDLPAERQVKKVAEFTGHQNPIYTLIAAPQSGRFFSAGGDKTIVEWNIHEPAIGIPIAQFKFTIYSLCLIKEANILLAGTSEGGIHVMDLFTKKEMKYIQLPGEAVFDIQYSEQHASIIASTAKGNLVFINSNHWQVVNILSLSTEKIRSIAFNHQRPYLYCACSDAHVYVIDLIKKEKVFGYLAHQWACNAALYNPINDQLITASKDAHIRVWDIKNEFSLIKSIPAHNYAIYQIIYNPDLNIYATASRDKTIKLWGGNMDIWVRINKENFNGHTHSVNSICWLTEKYLISGGDDRKIMLWEVGA